MLAKENAADLLLDDPDGWLITCPTLPCVHAAQNEPDRNRRKFASAFSEPQPSPQLCTSQQNEQGATPARNKAGRCTELSPHAHHADAETAPAHSQGTPGPGFMLLLEQRMESARKEKDLVAAADASASPLQKAFESARTAAVKPRKPKQAKPGFQHQGSPVHTASASSWIPPASPFSLLEEALYTNPWVGDPKHMR